MIIASNYNEPLNLSNSTRIQVANNAIQPVDNIDRDQTVDDIREISLRVRSNLSATYNNYVPLAVRRRISALKKKIRAVRDMFCTLTSVAHKLAIPEIMRIWNIVSFDVTYNDISVSSGIFRHLINMNVISFITLPFSVYYLADSVVKVCKGVIRGDNDMIYENGLDTVDRVSSLSCNIAYVLEGCGYIKIVAVQIVDTALPWLLGVGAAFRLCMIAREIKRIWDRNKFCASIANKPFKALRGRIKKMDDKQLSRALNIENAQMFRKRISKIFQRSKSDNGVLQKTVQAIKNKIITDNMSGKLKMLSMTVCIIAAAILFFTPLCYISFPLLGGGLIIGIVAEFVSDIGKTRFNNTLRELASA